MIEVEIKVKVTEEQSRMLVEGARLAGQIAFVDAYYDSADFKLTTNGLWLRQRDQCFELKVPATKDGTFHIGKNIPMHEITDEKRIRSILGLNEQGSLAEALQHAGYAILYRFENTRQTYEKEGFIIDFDRADFGGLTYSICEVEVLVESQDLAAPAFERLYAFAKQYGISTERAEGKLMYFMRMKNPAHYHAVINSPKHQAS